MTARLPYIAIVNVFFRGFCSDVFDLFDPLHQIQVKNIVGYERLHDRST